MGGRQPVVSDEEILDVIRGSSDPVVTTAEVAAQLPIKQNGVSKRLKQLSIEGRIREKDVGPGKVWWLEEGDTVSN